MNESPMEPYTGGADVSAPTVNGFGKHLTDGCVKTAAEEG